ncbi:hypothetical protein KCU85_g3679, partial [Aureobasidium melanogenum]
MPPIVKTGGHDEVLQVMTVSDITNQITARSPNGMIHYCAIVGEEAPDPRYPKIAPATKVVLQGDSATDRRTAMMTLLDQTEKKVAKEILKR